ncbi:hypothetical protein DICPUDRAFT_149485 [Dictyostelium purpureum]|uniref:Protein kinase domain-containing protein n=1 Tax=Dictyostelium purpureum TaxID=5786 RepID=F0ZDV4_DICPU|nr:uncharacterized protein DICPUDRAFT_149485 [Dictyostelium purpureum]EGC37869.1 hypothetical protein DICPUDRAFT_149485 [Dictyostelium purpureum]|eukprot:XP_003285619.1 hypothetical protein DICPUDRAFT_149485 [Dictyostelium purpureum]
MDCLPKHIDREGSINRSEPLGKGSLSEGVYKAKKLDGKIKDKQLPNNGECGKRELEVIDILIGLEKQCEQIIKFYGYGFGVDQNNNDNGLLYIYMEYLEGYHSIDKHLGDKGIHENLIHIILNNCLKGIEFLHDNNIIHRDIKCQNILIKSDLKIKIIDFGISKFTDYKASTIAGTPTHMSPETRRGETCFSSDFWSLGCTVIEMGCGDLTLDENDIPKIPKYFSNNLKFTTKLLLTKDPFSRNFFLNKDRNMTLKLIDGILNSRESLALTTIDLSNLKEKTPIPSTIKYLDLIIDEPISLHFIPSSVEYLTLSSYNHPTFPSGIPPTVKCLSMSVFNHPIPVDSIPRTLKALVLDSHNHPIKENSIPDSIKVLSLYSNTHDFEESSIPESVEALILGDNFNLLEHGDSIPSSIKIFSSNYNFKSPLKRNNNIPKNVQYLSLKNYNQSIIKESIPFGVSFLELGSKFTHFKSLKNLPKSLISLTIGVENTKDIDKILQNAPEININFK